MKDGEPAGRFSVKLAFYRDFLDYLICFESAVDRLYAIVSEAEATPYSVALPLLFLMRHSLELGYKCAITELHHLNGTGYKPANLGHRLQSLHAELKEIFYLVAERWRLPERVIEDFEHHYSNTGKCMEEFEQLDKNSEAF